MRQIKFFIFLDKKKIHKEILNKISNSIKKTSLY